MAKPPKNGAAAPAAPDPAPQDHNGPPTDAQIVEHRKEVLAALTAKHREVDNRIDVQQARVDTKQQAVDAEKAKLQEIRSERAQVRAAIHGLAPGGYPMDEFDRSYTDMRLKTSVIDIEQRERYRNEIREVHGQPTYAQMELDLERPRPEGGNVLVLWRSRGYQDGIMGLACDPQAAECPPEAIQEYNAGWGDGQAVVGRGIKQLEAPLPPAPKAGEVEGAPDWTDWPVDNTQWSAEQKERFADFYEGVPPDVTPLIKHAGAAAEFARLDALEKSAAGFEAGPDELGKQAGRRQSPDLN